MVPVGVVPGGDVMVPLTVTGALPAGLVGVTVCVTNVAPPTTARFVARLAVGDVAPAPTPIRLGHVTIAYGAIIHARADVLCHTHLQSVVTYVFMSTQSDMVQVKAPVVNEIPNLPVTSMLGQRRHTCRCVRCRQDIGSRCAWGCQGCRERAPGSKCNRAAHHSTSKLQWRSGV